VPAKLHKYLIAVLAMLLDFTYIMLLIFKIIKILKLKIILNISNIAYVKSKSITNTTFKHLRNLAGTDYELPEDDAVTSKHVGAVQ
jgi:hypothetical protein